MRRLYYLVADKLRNFIWGRSVVYHIGRHQRFYENFEALYTALILALIIKSFILEAYKIPSSSMLDTLQIGDRIFVSKFIYNFRDIHVGDIIVFKTENIPGLDSDNKPYYIKRVVGLPGDRIDISNGHIYRNGQMVTQPEFFLENEYYPLRRNDETHFVVPDGKVYVFGDNSRNSWDSRAWGGVPLENVMGKAFFRYWPLSRIGAIYDLPPEPVREKIARERTSDNPARFSPGSAQASEQ
ncbi:MAG TPA: signal peptidase I [bacterium]|nr:signal peptidase I [bacterium]